MKPNKYGTHRVLEPRGVLPQPAWAIDNDFSVLYDHEILFDVDTLNIDAASFLNLKKRADYDPEGVGKLVECIVCTRGKMHNPETGSGGMFIGRVVKCPSDVDLKTGDRVVSLVSLSLTPLYIEKIKKVYMDTDKVDIKGQAVLFTSGAWAKIPSDLPASLVLSVLDVAGAAAQTNRLVMPGDKVAVVGGRGKSGMLCCYQAKKRGGHVIAIVHSERGIRDVSEAPFVDKVIVASADDALDLYNKIEEHTKGDLCDVVINCVSRPDCEMGNIMITALGGTLYFFSMATNFTKAALGAEGVGKDINMLIGNGYCENHVNITLDIIRESEYLRNLYLKRYSDEQERLE